MAPARRSEAATSAAGTHGTRLTGKPPEGKPPEGKPPPRRVGRPSRIDRRAIAETVLAIGLEHASMKAVAAHLGISVPGLYHHVRNRKELLLLAAEHSLSRNIPPEDRGQHWSEWLREWARYTRSAFVEQPEVFAQFLSGALSWDQMVDVIDSVITVLTRQGFGVADAMAAWGSVTRAALGSVVQEIRLRAATEAGHPPLAELLRLLAERPADQLAGVRALLDTAPAGTEDAFEDELTTLLVGIAVRRGESPEDVLAGSH